MKFKFNKKTFLLSFLLLAFIFILIGIFKGDLNFTRHTATYGNFDVPNTQSWVNKLEPGIKDYASKVQYGEFNKIPLIAIGTLFTLTLLLSIIKNKKDLIWRKLSQWTMFVIARLGVFRVSGICPIKRTEFGVFPVLNCQACEMATGGCPIGMIQWSLINRRFPFYALGIVLLFGSILGRTICGWLCPFGFFVDILDRYLYIKKLRNKIKPIFALQYVKYMILIFVFTAFIWVVPYFCIYICQSANIYGLLPYYLTTGLEGFKNAISSTGIIHTIFMFHMISLSILIIFSMLFGGRWYCKFICPLGAIYGLFNLISPIQVKHDDSKCVNCKLCNKTCPMNVDLKRNSFNDKTSCIRCGRCTKLCKARNFEIAGITLIKDKDKDKKGSDKS